MTKLRIVIVSTAAAALTALGSATVGSAGPAPAAQSNDARAAQLQAHQEAVVGSTHGLIAARFGALKGVMSAASERAAVDTARAALEAQANVVDAVTQQAMAEVRQMLRVPVTKNLRAQHVANEARAVKLQAFQEAVVRKTHDVIQTRLPALKRVLSGANEKAAVDTVRTALHAQAKLVHVVTQQTMTELLQMLRRSINQLNR